MSCDGEGQNLTLCWVCVFYFSLCFPLLLSPQSLEECRVFYMYAISIHSGLPCGTPSLCLNVEVPLFSSRRNTLTLPACLWMAAEKKKLTSPLHRLTKPGDILQDFQWFYFTSSSPSLSLFYKRNWYPDHDKMVL